jgi:hypothetical protein
MRPMEIVKVGVINRGKLEESNGFAADARPSTALHSAPININDACV